MNNELKSRRQRAFTMLQCLQEQLGSFRVVAGLPKTDGPKHIKDIDYHLDAAEKYAAYLYQELTILLPYLNTDWWYGVPPLEVIDDRPVDDSLKDLRDRLIRSWMEGFGDLTTPESAASDVDAIFTEIQTAGYQLVKTRSFSLDELQFHIGWTNIEITAPDGEIHKDWSLGHENAGTIFRAVRDLGYEVIRRLDMNMDELFNSIIENVYVRELQFFYTPLSDPPWTAMVYLGEGEVENEVSALSMPELLQAILDLLQDSCENT